MSAALALSALAAAGGELRADGRRLRLLARAPLPPEVSAAVRAAAPALLRVASDRWREEMGGWPADWVDLWNEYAGRRQDSGEPVALAERLAFFDVLEADERGELAPETPETGGLPLVPAELYPAVQPPAPRGEGPAVGHPHARAPEADRSPRVANPLPGDARAAWDREAADWRAFLAWSAHPAASVDAVLRDALGPRPAP